jgi:hypothetical protein
MGMMRFRNMWYDLKFAVRMTYQRWTRGYSADEVWDLNSHVAAYLVPRLRALRDRTDGFPGDLDEHQWRVVLTDMVDGFEVAASEVNFSEDERKRVQRALDLFSQHFFSLWY